MKRLGAAALIVWLLILFTFVAPALISSASWFAVCMGGILIVASVFVTMKVLIRVLEGDDA